MSFLQWGTPSFSFFSFFRASIICKKTENTKINLPQFLLPEMDKLTPQKSLAKVFMGWNEEGISVLFKIHEPKKSLEKSDDTLELFFDTRDLKTKNQFSRFCHHFIFQNASEDSLIGKEITRFPTEDTHPLASIEMIPKIKKIKSTRDQYEILIFLPALILFGYDPLNSSKKIGFAYVLKRKSTHEEQIFPVVREFSLAKNPSCWSTLELSR